MSLKPVFFVFGLLSIGFFLLQDFWMCTGFVLISLIYLFFRFKSWKILLIWIMLAGLFFIRIDWKMEQPEAGEYRIIEIHENYALAQGKNQNILIYDPQDLTFDTLIQADSFSRIHSLNNLNLFSFEKKMAQRKVFYQTEDYSVLKQGSSVRAEVYQWISLRDQNGLYRMLFYQFSMENMPEWIVTMGFPVTGGLSLIKKIMERHLSMKQAGWSVLLLGLMASFLFARPVSLIRWCTFLFIRLMVSDFEKRFALSSILFLMICPNEAASFCFVLPVILSLAGHFNRNLIKRKIISVVLCAGLQIIYFSKLSIFSLLGYGWMRKLFGFLFWISLPGLFLPVIQDLILMIIKACSFSLDWLTFIRAPGIIFTAGFCLLCFMFLKGADRKGFILSMLLLAGWMVWPQADPFSHIYMYDIGQGDCTMIMDPFKRNTVMIDAAGNTMRNNAEKIILPFMESLHLTKLDYLVITHDDLDHSGSRDGLMAAFPSLKVIEDQPEAVDVRWPFEFLLTERKEYEDENNNSLIVYFSHDQFSFLFTGDAEAEVERELVKNYELKADVLKLGHHGSDTSSTPEFLEAVSPELGLISSGYENRYGHPSLKTLINARKLGIDLLNTADQGMVHIICWHNLMIIECADGTFSWMVKV